MVSHSTLEKKSGKSFMEPNESCVEKLKYESPKPKQKGVWVELSESEVAVAKAIGKWRHQVNRARGFQVDGVGARCDYIDMDVEGVGAEMAFCKIMNIYPDLVISGGEYPSHDCVMQDGTRVDVKQTNSQNNNLITKLGNAGADVDAYALVLGKLPRYRVFGIATKEELINDANIVDLGYGPTYLLKQSQVKDIKEFINERSE